MSKDHIKKLLFSGILLVFLPLSGTYPQDEADEKKIDIEYSTLEYKALRYEMIEKDIYIRTISSMISLGRVDKIKEWAEKLSKTATAESPYYKHSIASVYRKWKKYSTENFEKNIQTSAIGIVKIIEKSQPDMKTLDWSEINRYYNTILENCRGCHDLLGVKKP